MVTGKSSFFFVIAFVLASCATAVADDFGACLPEKTRWLPIGSICHTNDATWLVEGTMALTASTYFRDLKSGLAVTQLTDQGETYGSTRAIKQSSAASLCAPDANVEWRLPSGYPTRYAGQYGFPNRKSDFSVMADDGVVNVVEHINHFGRISWTQSPFYQGTQIWSSSRVVGDAFAFYILSFPDDQAAWAAEEGERPFTVHHYVCVGSGVPREPTPSEARPLGMLSGGCASFFENLAVANRGPNSDYDSDELFEMYRLIAESYRERGEVLHRLFTEISRSSKAPRTEVELARMIVAADKAMLLCEKNRARSYDAVRRTLRNGTFPEGLRGRAGS